MRPAASRLSLRSSSLACLVLALCVASTGAARTSDDIYRDCSDLPPLSPSGVYTLRPGMVALDVPAYCDMDQDGGGWTVVVRRGDIEPREDFYQDWETYKWGLGELEQEFYWGNEYLWMLTSQLDRRYQVHFWLEDWDGYTRYALYEDFVIESEAANFRLQVGEYSGDAGDSFAYNNNHYFSTYDSDNDTSRHSCAENREGAWWYGDCTNCQLTGQYYEGGHSGDAGLGITWWFWKSTEPFSLKSAVMKIKPSEKA